MRRVYFLRPVGQDGPIKIGYSSYPKARAKQISCDTKVPLEVILEMTGGNLTEFNLHQKFAAYRTDPPFSQSRAYIVGAPTEWFAPTPELLDFIQRAKDCGRLPLLPSERVEVVVERMRAQGAPWRAIGERFNRTGEWARQVHRELNRRASLPASSPYRIAA